MVEGGLLGLEGGDGGGVLGEGLLEEGAEVVADGSEEGVFFGVGGDGRGGERGGVGGEGVVEGEEVRKGLFGLGLLVLLRKLVLRWGTLLRWVWLLVWLLC